ncbi:Protein RRP5-like protein [Entamoeba marina]
MARLEYKYGGIDKGRAIFDVWNVYIDMEQQVGDVNVIRRLFERIVKLKLSTKTMKTFLTKYLEFETNNGDEKRMDHVREIAKSFVDSK